MRPCEICGNSDLGLRVAASRIAPMSYGLCAICLIMGAEDKHLLEISYDMGPSNITFYDKSKDAYIYYDNNKCAKIRYKHMIFSTRQEAILYFISEELLEEYDDAYNQLARR